MIRKIFKPVFIFFRHLRNKFLLGLLVIVPVGVTILILVWAFNSIDNILRPIIITTWGKTYPGIGFGIVVLLVYLAGLLASSFFGRKIISFAESLLDRLPLFKQLFRSIQQITRSFSNPRESGFMQVVFLEYPRKGIYSIGFITNVTHSDTGKHIYSVFIPTAPNPTSGFLLIVGEDEITRTKMSIEDAIKVVISAGTAPLDPRGLEIKKDNSGN
jgi:uncharacterized membrane protein